MKNRKNHRKQSDYCHQSGKKRFRDPREATARLQSLLNQARLLDEQGKDHTIHVVRKYRCNACRGWHLTSWENYGAPKEAAPATPAVPVGHDPLMISLAASIKRTRTAKKGTQRAQDMCERRAAGETLDEIGRAYGVTASASVRSSRPQAGRPGPRSRTCKAKRPGQAGRRGCRTPSQAHAAAPWSYPGRVGGVVRHPLHPHRRAARRGHPIPCDTPDGAQSTSRTRTSSAPCARRLRSSTSP